MENILLIPLWGERRDTPNATENAAEARNDSLNMMTALACPGLCWRAFALPVGTGSDAKIAPERFAKGNFRIVADRGSDFNQCCRLCPQQSSGLREPHTSDVLHRGFANKLFELCRKR